MQPNMLAWLAALPPAGRDAALEEYLGIVSDGGFSHPPGEHLIGYHPSAVASIVRALVEVSLGEEDVVIDLGAGLGKVVFVTHLLTVASARGIELQPALVRRARATASHLGIDVRFTEADARVADLDDGTVFFLYAPFTGPVLAEVLARLHLVATRRAIVVCALGIDLERTAPWLAPRPLDAFWLTVYDSVVTGTPPRSPRLSPGWRGPGKELFSLGSLANAIAFERSA